MAFMNINLTGETFVDDPHIVDAGSDAYELSHDWFTKEDLVITTGTGGGGTPLSEGVDYQLLVEDTDLSARVTAAVGSTRTVYHKVQIINATYQTGDLYHSGKYIADSNDADDIEYRAVVAISGEDYTFTDDDKVGTLELDPDGADRTVTLPTVADNPDREITIANSATIGTAYKVIVDGEDAELINYVTTWWVFPGESITIKSNGTIWRKKAGHVPILHIEDQKAATTDGGGFTSGAWQTRDLNTEAPNEIAGASLSSNQITLPAGMYEVIASAPAYHVSRHMVRLQNITDGTSDLWGANEYFSTTNSGVTQSFLRGVISITSTKVFELQHRCEVTQGTNGFGLSIGSQFTVDHETYSMITIKKLV